ncbi:hypothetical protein [Candidatus Palauibacter sp.]|uniref:hypothetical protein n=1 Tax=Candidatus Palauibacter sp. TaxID=3101350 RepID=UPI003B5A228C
MTKAFWGFLKEQTGGLPGQSDDWRSWNRWTTWLNDARDMIGISLADEWVGLYIRADERQNTPRRAARMLQYSRKIRDFMGDQELEGDEEARSKEGRTISVSRPWERGDKDGWPEAAWWIKDQVERLQAILDAPPL